MEAGEEGGKEQKDGNMKSKQQEMEITQEQTLGLNVNQHTLITAHLWTS